MADPIKVFLVEDDEIFGFLVDNKLSKFPDISLSIFEMGQGCLDSLGEEPDVVFLDYSLPVTDGFEILKQIKKIRPETRVVMLSGLEWQQVVDECLEAGAEDFIQKDSQVANKVYGKLQEMFPSLQ
ncbi:MAG TPA: response regulator [Bacteroidetes bacterium]|nr:response regulator [Bacteroidota bacterium]